MEKERGNERERKRERERGEREREGERERDQIGCSPVLEYTLDQVTVVQDSRLAKSGLLYKFPLRSVTQGWVTGHRNASTTNRENNTSRCCATCLFVPLVFAESWVKTV